MQDRKSRIHEALVDAQTQLLVALDRVGPDHWPRISPNEGWTVRDLSLHVLGSADAQASVKEFLHQFVRGAELQTCLEFGNLCGAFSTTADGGTEAFRNRTRMKEFFRNHGALA